MTAHPVASSPRSSLPSWASTAAILVGLLTFYLAIFQHYRPYEMDNPWFLSFSYGQCVEHIGTDQFMDVSFPAGMAGTQVFGKLAAYPQCAVASLFGWQQWPAVVLSATCVVLALAFWALQLDKLGYSRRYINCFLIATGVSEPLLSTANKFRFEFAAFALISLGLYLIVRGYALLGIFVAALAIEVEPAALAGLIPAIVLAFSTAKITRSLLLRLAVGLALAGAVYFALHPTFGLYLAKGGSAARNFDWGFFHSYFLQRPRHYPEMLCFAVAGVVYWFRRRAIPSHYLGISAGLLTLFSIVIPHGNPWYMVFAFPFLVAVTLTAFAVDRRPALIMACVLLFNLSQLVYLARITRNLGLRSADVAQISQAIDESARTLQVPEQNLHLFGDYRLWFAHPHFYRAATLSTEAKAADADLYLCYDSPPQPLMLEPAGTLYCPDLNKLLPLRSLGTVVVRNYPIHLYAKK